MRNWFSVFSVDNPYISVTECLGGYFKTQPNNVSLVLFIMRNHRLLWLQDIHDNQYLKLNFTNDSKRQELHISLSQLSVSLGSPVS